MPNTLSPEQPNPRSKMAAKAKEIREDAKRQKENEVRNLIAEAQSFLAQFPPMERYQIRGQVWTKDEIVRSVREVYSFDKETYGISPASRIAQLMEIALTQGLDSRMTYDHLGTVMEACRQNDQDLPTEQRVFPITKQLEIIGLALTTHATELSRNLTLSMNPKLNSLEYEARNNNESVRYAVDTQGIPVVIITKHQDERAQEGAENVSDSEQVLRVVDLAKTGLDVGNKYFQESLPDAHEELALLGLYLKLAAQANWLRTNLLSNDVV